MDILLLATVFAMQGSFPSTALPYELRVGQIEVFDVVTKTALTIDEGGADSVSANTQLEICCEMEVVDVTPEFMEAVIRWTKVKGFVEVPLFGQVMFDSMAATPATDPGTVLEDVRAPWLSLANVEYGVRVDRAGLSLDLSDVDHSLRDTRQRVLRVPNSGMVEALLQNESLCSQARLLFPAQGPQGIAVGDSWPNTLDEHLGNSEAIAVKSENVNTLVRASREESVIRTTSRVVLGEDEKPLNGHRHQAVVIDSRTGLVKRGLVHLQLVRSKERWFRGKVRSSICVESTVARNDVSNE